MRLYLLAGLVTLLTSAACNASYHLETPIDAPSMDARPTDDGGVSAPNDGTFGPTGRTIPVNIEATNTPAGVVVTFGSTPSTISVSPSSATIDQSGRVTTYALVPYGQEGVVTATAQFANTIAVHVSANPLTLCSPTTNVVSATALGQVYSIGVTAIVDGKCESGTYAPPGIPIVFTLTPVTGTSAAATTATVTTSDQGIATINTAIIWGTGLLVQVVGGGGSTSTSIAALPNPASVTCMQWSSQDGVYRVTARVSRNSQPDLAIPVSFSTIFPSSASASFSPTAPTTDASGVATTFASIPDLTKLPVVVEAVAGSSVMEVVISNQQSGSSGTCP